MSSQTRTTFEIWFPFGLMVRLAAASWATMWRIAAWLAVGVSVLNKKHILIIQTEYNAISDAKSE